MPSGAKKRKAAKKKKKTINGRTQLHGDDDDLIVHEGKDSDGGDVSSPLSQIPEDDLRAASVGGDDDVDDKEEEEEEESPSVRSNVAVENEPLLVENGESTVKVTVEEEIPVENSGFENKLTNQDPEIHENPSGGDDDASDSSSSSSSSSDSSDDESQAIEKKKEDSIEAEALELSNPVLLVEQKDEELTESPSLDLDLNLDLSSKPDDLPAEITQSKSVSDVSNVINLETTPLTSDEPVEIAKVEILPTLNNNNGEIRLKENEIKVDKQVSTTVQETTTVTAPVLSSSTVVSTAVTNNVNDQPRVVVTTPKPTQRTSMASCCGLFALFTGSN